MEQTSKPIWHGVVLVAGGAIGAGMFALPVISAGMWFTWACLAMACVCTATYIAAVLLVDVNTLFEPGASFHTIVASIIGRRFAWVNNVTIGFIMLILMYAYITAGASILDHTLSNAFKPEALPSRGVLSLLFAALIALLVWLGTSTVSRVSTVLFILMALTFLMANLELGALIDWRGVMDLQYIAERSRYVWAGVPVFVTAFACAGLVPSLVKHYDGDGPKIKRTFRYGLLLVLLVYSAWLLVTFGALPRDAYLLVIEAGGNIGDLVSALQDQGASDQLRRSLDWFARLAIVTSFLSIGLGLFHFLSDGLGLPESRTGRAQTALITFVPPAVLSFFFPYGFVTAIGYAGLLVAFSFFMVPAILHIKRFGVRFTSIFILTLGVLIAVLKILTSLSVLPSFGA